MAERNEQFVHAILWEHFERQLDFTFKSCLADSDNSSAELSGRICSGLI